MKVINLPILLDDKIRSSTDFSMAMYTYIDTTVIYYTLKTFFSSKRTDLTIDNPLNPISFAVASMISRVYYP